MAKVRVTMLCTSATPDRILHEGKTYLLDSAEADELRKAGAGKFPGAAAARDAVQGEKLTKIDVKPDPGEQEEPEDEDDDEGS